MGNSQLFHSYHSDHTGTNRLLPIFFFSTLSHSDMELHGIDRLHPHILLEQSIFSRSFDSHLIEVYYKIVYLQMNNEIED